MSATDLLCLNRIIKPQIPLEEFLKFTADLGIKYIELRNDFTDKGILDGLSDAALQKAFKDTGIKVHGAYLLRAIFVTGAGSVAF
jgi:predicted xylose isomerase-like sugar epimerase